MRIAAFDFGSNALKCLVCDTSGQNYTVLAEGRISTRLAASIAQSSALSDETISKTIQACQQLISQHCSPHQVQLYLAAGTQALRIATNASDLVKRLRHQTGIELQVVSPETEARLSWLGAMQDQKGELALIDIGGASAELSFGSESGIAHSYSLLLGAVSLSKRFLSGDPPSEHEVSMLYRFIRDSLPFFPIFTGKLTGCGGGFTACAKVAMGNPDPDQSTLNGYVLDLAEIQRQEKLYLSLGINQRKAIAGMEAERADIIPAFCSLLSMIMEALSAKHIVISTKGLRQGLIINYLLQK